MDAETKKSLFRTQPLHHLTQRLHGEISVAVPMSWQVIGYFLLTAFIVASVFVCTASYARVESVSGAVGLDKGIISIMPSRPGIVTELLVREGASVTAGDPLLRIRAEENLEHGDTAPELILTALGRQDRSFETQASLLTRASLSEQGRLLEQISGLEYEIEGLDAQIDLQERVIQLAERLFRKAQDVAAKGFISGHDLDESESDLLAKRQQLFQLQQNRAAKMAELAGARRTITQAVTNAQAQVAGLSSSRAQVAQQVAQARSARGYALTSPVEGRVTAVTARVGQPASVSSPTMMVVPTGSRQLAELYVPSSAVGFLEIGQEVRLNIDAFPYERFGVVRGKIAEIAAAAMLRTMPDGNATPIYLVTVTLPQPWIEGFGRRQSLLAGMTLSARIVTRKQTLLEWLFEPIYAVSRR